MIDAEFLSAAVKNIPFVCTLLGIILSTLLINCQLLSKESIFKAKMSVTYRTLYTFLTQKWHFDQISNEIVVVKSMSFGYRNSFQLIDKGCIEMFGPSGFAFNTQLSSKALARYQSGFVSNYAAIFMVVILLLGCFTLIGALDLGNVANCDSLLAVAFGYLVLCYGL